MGLHGELVQVTCTKQTAGFLSDARVSLQYLFLQRLRIFVNAGRDVIVRQIGCCLTVI